MYHVGNEPELWEMKFIRGREANAGKKSFDDIDKTWEQTTGNDVSTRIFCNY